MKGGKKIAIAMAVCLCVVAISVGIYFGTKKKPQADKKTDSESSTTDDATPTDKKTDSESSATDDATPMDKKTDSESSATPTDKKTDSESSATPADKKTDSTAPVVNTGSDNLTPVTAPVSSGLLDSDSESDDDDSGGLAPVTSSTPPTPAPEKSDADKLMEAFLKDGKGKFNKHLPGYCLNWKKKDQNKGDINYGKKTVAECKKVCFDKGPDGSDELTACEWGKGDVNSTTDRANCIGHTADINRYSASGHDNRICWTTAAPENHDNEKLYGKM